MSADPRQLAEYLRFLRELGVEDTAISSDIAARLVAANNSPAATPPAPEPASPSAKAAAAARRAPAQPAPAPRPAQISMPGNDSFPIALADASGPGRADGADPAEQLRQIRADLGDCTRCKLHAQGRRQIVFGVGNPRARLVFVGEGPGADEDAQGIPFVGRAGRLLTDMIEKGMGLRRDDVYICNVVKCRPPNNRTPENDETAACSPFLRRQLAAIRPEMVCALGAVAAQNLLGRRGPIGGFRGTVHRLELEGFTTRLVVTYHPAYLLRDPSQKKETWKDLQIVMRELGLPLPARS